MLGPHIFISFIDDIIDCMDASEVNPTSCSNFADDLKIYCSYDSIHDNPSLAHTKSWYIMGNSGGDFLVRIPDGHKLACNVVSII